MPGPPAFLDGFDVLTLEDGTHQLRATAGPTESVRKLTPTEESALEAYHENTKIFFSAYALHP